MVSAKTAIWKIFTENPLKDNTIYLYLPILETGV